MVLSLAMTQSRLPTLTLNPISTVDALASALRDQILDGTLRAGSPLREAELSDAFGVSRHSLRSALQELSHEGLVRSERNRGAFVRQLVAEDVIDAYRIRVLLETAAARSLAGNTDALAPARRVLDGMKSLEGDGEWGRVRDADLAFHQALVDALGSDRISRVFRDLIVEMRLCFLQLRHELDPTDVHDEHSRMLEAIELGDKTDEAVALLRAHLERARDEIANALTAAPAD